MKTNVSSLSETIAPETLNQETLNCPLCGWEHDAEGFDLGKRTSGNLKCMDCGEEFEWEATRTVRYSTY